MMMPDDLCAAINMQVEILHVLEQKEKFDFVIRDIEAGGTSPNEDLPDLINLRTGIIWHEDIPGWSSRVTEFSQDINEISIANKI